MAESQTNHELEAGDELTDSDNDETLTVTEVHDDGSVTWRVEETGETETHEQESVVTGLEHSEIVRTDGKSHELVNHF